MAVRFQKDATSVYLQNPVRGNNYERRKATALGRSAGGELYAYRKGINTKKITIEWEYLRNDERVALENFFFVTVDGPMETFTYTDHRGDSYTAQFLQDSIRFEEIDDEKDSSSTYTVGSTSYPTTTRRDPVWRASVEMELN